MSSEALTKEEKIVQKAEGFLGEIKEPNIYKEFDKLLKE